MPSWRQNSAMLSLTAQPFQYDAECPCRAPTVPDRVFRRGVYFLKIGRFSMTKALH